MSNTVMPRNHIGQTDIGEEIGKIAEEGVQESVSNEVFVSYQHREVVPGCHEHPGDIVEASSLAALEPPDPTYPLKDSLPKQLIEGGGLSSLQLAGILYACQRHQFILPNGNRAGFFLGDAAGVGKGRQIAGIILDNFARKRTKHIWFSIAADLIYDARRDLADIGCHIKVIEGCQQLDKETRLFGLPADFKEGVIFSTYATLVSSVQRGGSLSSSRQSRLQQLIDWCGGAAFDGCLIFDECHKAKNFVPGKDESSSKVALAVAAIQKLLPKARVVYCSATGVTDVKNMAFMERLGLWGDGATFKSFEEFIDIVQRKGLGVAEMLAMEMKSTGMYLSRGLSFKETEFETVEISLTQEQIKMYGTAAHLWNELKKSLEHAVERCGNSNNRMWLNYWSAHQRFFKQLCMGIKVPAIVQLTKDALEKGQCVVIGLQTTGEASMDVELTLSNGKVSEFVSLCREILKRFIQQHFPTVVEGKATAQGPAEDDWSVTAKQMLLGFAGQIELPNSPLDELIDQLGGPEAVAEMTGRKGRIVRQSAGDKRRYESRGAEASKEMESLNVKERNAFMEGKKLVAIISDAASTGISLHADKRVANQRRRVHMTLELPWSADKAVQQMGRSHRSNQSSGPLYRLLTTNLGGERRFAAAVARRLQSLGALTKGDRRAASGTDLNEFNFDTPYGRQALRNMYASICQKHIANGVTLHSVTKDKLDFAQFNDCMQSCLSVMGLLDAASLGNLPRVKDSVAGNVGTFLNRILGLKVEKQNLIFNYFCKCLDALVSNAKKEGRYTEGMVDVTASSIELIGEPRMIFEKKHNRNNPTYHKVVEVDRGMSWEQALTRLKNHPGEHNGFYCSRRDVRGRRLYVLATMKENSSHVFKIARPSTGVSSFDEDKQDLHNKYVPVSADKAEASWKEQYNTAYTKCLHGPNCRNGASCNVGVRCHQIHLLCGGIVTLLTLLETTLLKYGPQLNLMKAERNLRVVRVQLNSGERIVGVRYPQMLIPIAEKELEEQKKIAQFLQQQQQLNWAKNQRQVLGVNGASNIANNAQIQNSQLSLVTSTVASNVKNNSQSASAILTQQLQGQREGHAVQESDVKDKPQAQIIIEEVAPVVEKYLLKATTPPVTIKNFFKPKIRKADHNEETEDESKDIDARIHNDDKKCEKSSESKRSSDVSEAADDVVICDTSSTSDQSEAYKSGNTSAIPDNASTSNCNVESAFSSNGTVSTGTSSEMTTDTTNSTITGTSNNTGAASTASSTSNDIGNRATTCRGNQTTVTNRGMASTSSGSKKRPLSGSSSTKLTTNKKSKTQQKSRSSGGGGGGGVQRSIMSSFAKVKTINEQQEKKSLTCPICGKVFERSTSNDVINLHVDNCLIE